MPRTKKQSESPYTRRQRRRAERIIAASGCYSVGFRNEVQLALDSLPHKLPVLFREADRIDQRLESAGRSIRTTLRKGGIPIGEPSSKPMSRSPKNVVVREAEEIESVFVQYQNDNLNKEMAERAELISTILYDAGGEAQIDANHPLVAKAYYVAIRDAITELSYKDCERVWRMLNQVRDLMNGCSEARYEQIDTIYNGDSEESRKARFEEAGDDYEAWKAQRAQVGVENEAPAESEALVTAREKRTQLEDLPENEAVAFRMESEIYKLESETDEWPDVIGGVQ